MAFWADRGLGVGCGRSVSRLSFWLLFLLDGAYRALLIFGVMLLAGRIAPVISVVVFYWVERIAPVRVWVWRAWWCSGGLVLFFPLVARGVCFFF